MKKYMTLITLVVTIVMVFAMALPANATTAGALAFVAEATLPDFPCGNPAGCDVSSISGPVVGALAGTAPNGVTVCAAGPFGCTISEPPDPNPGVHYDEPPCVQGRIPAQGSATGDVQVNGPGLTVLGADKVPQILHISYQRFGVVAIVTFTQGQTGAAVGIFIPDELGGTTDCIAGNGPTTIRVIGVGVAVD